MNWWILAFLVAVAAGADQADNDIQIPPELAEPFANMEDTPGSLRRAMNIPEAQEQLDKVEHAIKSSIREILKDALDKLIEKMKNKTKDIENFVKHILDKVEELKDNVDDRYHEKLQIIKEKVREIIYELMDKLGIDPTNLDHHMDALARMQYRNYLTNRIKEKVTTDPVLQKIRHYIENLEEFQPWIVELKDVVKKLQQKDLKSIVRAMFETRHKVKGISDTWEDIRHLFRTAGKEFKQKLQAFGQWLKDTVGGYIFHIRDKTSIAKSVALQMVSKCKDQSAQAGTEVFSFLETYKEDLGDLWDQLQEATMGVIGRF